MTEYYKKKLKEGEGYQIFIKEIFNLKGIEDLHFYDDKEDQYNIGETEEGYEIKFDNKYKETGNLYIEISEKSNSNNPNYIASGIYRNDNTKMYVIGNKYTIYVFRKKVLKEIQSLFREVTTPTSIGFLIPKEEAKKHVKYILEIKYCLGYLDLYTEQIDAIKKYHKDKIVKENKFFN